jgi:type I restriction enzyme R subunit
MIATGTDVKPIEIVFFMRNVKSAAFFEQMKGRGVRVISPDKLRVVSPTARWKDRFIIVDAVGVCEHDKTESCTLNRQPAKPLNQLLEYVAQGGTDADALITLAGRLARVQREFSIEQLAELQELAGGRSLPEIAHSLLTAVNTDRIHEVAVANASGSEPTEKQIKQAAAQLAQEAVTPIMKAAFRRRLLEIRSQNEQTIDRHSIDDVLYSGFDASAVQKAQAKVHDFRQWIDENHDELTALQVLYAGTRPLKIALKDLRKLKRALEAPPLNARPEGLWRAFQAVDGGKVQGNGGKPIADLVALVRHALKPESLLRPYADEVRTRYQQWLIERDAANNFSAEQRQWLDRMAEHIATSLRIAPQDFDAGWFAQQGSLGRATALFGNQLEPLMAELNEVLAA